MKDDHHQLKKRLREAGLSDPLIDAAWPSWWSEDSYQSPSANAELRFTIARKLGLSPESLFHDDVEFVWKDDARFKNLSNETDTEQSILTTYGVSIGKLLLRSIGNEFQHRALAASELRAAILQGKPFVDLQSLLGTCWALGIPVVHLRVFPLRAKRMHAMVVTVAEQNAILLGRDSNYPAPVAFTLAHEIGHIMLGHTAAMTALIDVGESGGHNVEDTEENEADRYALELLSGSPEPSIATNVESFNSPQLANAVLTHGPELGIEPGTLALCLAYQRDIWPIANAAMSLIYAEEKPVWQQVNQIAMSQLNLDSLTGESNEFLTKVMGFPDVE